jgi:NAD(P)H-dependent FMN reductase
MKTLVVLGTGREGRMSERVSKFVMNNISGENELVDVRDYASGMTVAKWAPDSVSGKWAEKVECADRIVLVSPEYNYSYPGELKILFDRLVDEYKDKPIYVVSVSAGGFAGVRVVEELRSYLGVLGFKWSGVMNVGHVGDEFAEDGSTENHKHLERLKRMLG